MQRLHTPKKLLRLCRQHTEILQRYEVHPHAYGHCPKCHTYFDYWKYGETDFKCPSCGNPLSELPPAEVAEALIDCEEQGCMEEEFVYRVPLRPVLREDPGFEFCKLHKMFDFGRYIHCRRNRRGDFTLYEGRCGQRSGCVVGLRVIRGKDGRPLRFATISEAHKWAKEHGRVWNLQP